MQQHTRQRSRSSSVSFLQELLQGIGYEIPSSDYSGKKTEVAIEDFHRKNQVVVAGELGIREWDICQLSRSFLYSAICR